MAKKLLPQYDKIQKILSVYLMSLKIQETNIVVDKFMIII